MTTQEASEAYRSPKRPRQTGRNAPTQGPEVLAKAIGWWNSTRFAHRPERVCAGRVGTVLTAERLSGPQIDTRP